MRLPKKITPDALREAFVEVHYEANLPPEVLFGLFHQALAPEFTYVPRTLHPLPLAGVQLEAHDEGLFQGDGVYVRLHDHHIAFGCTGNEYPGWAHYSQTIQQVVTKLHRTTHIKRFVRVGLRYINALPWKPLNEQLVVQLPPLDARFTPQRTQYRTELHTAEGFTVTLMLYNSEVATDDAETRSVFDVDVVWPQPDMPTLEAVLARIDQAHQCEKEVFFGLLNPLFLDSLKPEYD